MNPNSFGRYHYASFVSATSSNVATDLRSLPEFPDACKNCIVSGPPGSGKTCLLFHFAVHTAAKSGRPVVCICKRHKLEQSPPLLPPGSAGTDAPMQNVQLRYLSTLEDVHKYASCCHMKEPLPAAILVDGLSAFTPRGSDKRVNDAELIRTIAQLNEAAAFISASLGPSTSCPLLIAEEGSEKDGPHSLYLYHKWFQLVLVATGNTLQVLDQCAEWHPLGGLAGVKVRYSLGQSYMSATQVERM